VVSKVTTLGWHTPTLACVQIGGQYTAARFFIDVRGVGGRVLTESVRCTAEACRCPSTPAPSSLSRRSQKHHTSLSNHECNQLNQSLPKRKQQQCYSAPNHQPAAYHSAAFRFLYILFLTRIYTNHLISVTYICYRTISIITLT